MESPSTTLLPSPSYTVSPPTSAAVTPPGQVSDVCMRMARDRMCEARYHRQMESLHSSASWYGTVYAVIIITVYFAFCLVLLLRARSTFSYSARGNLQACRVVSRPIGGRRLATRDVTNDSTLSTESAPASEPGCSTQRPVRPRNTQL